MRQRTALLRHERGWLAVFTLANNRGCEVGCPLQSCIGVLRGGGMSVASGLFADR